MLQIKKLKVTDASLNQSPLLCY